MEEAQVIEKEPQTKVEPASGTVWTAERLELELQLAYEKNPRFNVEEDEKFLLEERGLPFSPANFRVLMKKAATLPYDSDRPFRAGAVFLANWIQQEKVEVAEGKEPVFSDPKQYWAWRLETAHEIWCHGEQKFTWSRGVAKVIADLGKLPARVSETGLARILGKAQEQLGEFDREGKVGWPEYAAFVVKELEEWYGQTAQAPTAMPAKLGCGG